MSTAPPDDDRLPTHEGLTRRLPRRSIDPARIAAMLQDPLPEATPAPPGLRFDRPHAAPPRPHLALSAHRVWTEILNSAIGDDADTSLIHDLANLHPQVTATILRTVNAAQGGVIRPVHEVGLAIELLGLRRLRHLATEHQGRTAPPRSPMRPLSFDSRLSSLPEVSHDCHPRLYCRHWFGADRLLDGGWTLSLAGPPLGNHHNRWCRTRRAHCHVAEEGSHGPDARGHSRDQRFAV